MSRAYSDGLLERLFRLRENGTDVRTEVVAGLTTFMTMAYIVILNPSILSETGMPIEAVMVATAISAALSTFLMAFLANYPFGLAPGIGLIVYFTHSVVLGQGIPWQTALGAVFISGLVFFILSVSRVRELLVRAVPDSLKSAIGAGIGLFIALIGLQNGGLILIDSESGLSLGSLSDPEVLVTALGILITAGLMARRVRGAILIGLLATAGLGMLFGVIPVPTAIVAWPDLGAWGEIVGALDIRAAFELGLFTVIFAFLFVDLFDTIGTLIGIAKQGGFLDEQGQLPRAKQALMADSAGSIIGSVAGTPTIVTYIESASGVAEGGRTGLTGVVIGLGFLGTLFFHPLISVIATSGAITGPALFIVGSLMARLATGVPWDEPDEAIPAFTAMVAMPFTFSIAEGIALAFIVYPVAKVFAGKARDVHWIVWMLAALFTLRYVYLM